MLGRMMAGMFLLFWGVRGVGGGDGAALRRALGDRRGVGSRAGFVVLFFALSIAGVRADAGGNTFSRHFEHEADVYGQEAIHGLVADPQKTAVSSFNHLGEAWLEDPTRRLCGVLVV